MIEQSFHQSEKVNEADLQSRSIKFLYTNRGEHWFTEAADRLKISATGRFSCRQTTYVKQNDLVDLLSFNDQPIALAIQLKFN